ncbi:methyltransferase domain-containing protein [Kutzneria sp. NPDC052558]|uniref:methyltransferase domain-containing protein n=1 Tax=Kutzneria sp. NPDC052558 TaxID=3364121 RepID=UPI0037C79D55
MAAPFDTVRLIGPPAADGEYVALADDEVVHLHDYPRIYAVPGLYEHIVQDLLQCRSPQVVAEAFLRLAPDPAALTVLDFGSGTGLVGELLRSGGATRVIGVDALPAARDACLRDRPTTYSDYLLGDLASTTDPLLPQLRAHHPTALISAGAFGGTHAPPAALLNALSLLPPNAPFALTIHEQWLDPSDQDGFGPAIADLLDRGDLVLTERTRFLHRLTTTGAPIFYELLAGAIR